MGEASGAEGDELSDGGGTKRREEAAVVRMIGAVADTDGVGPRRSSAPPASAGGEVAVDESREKRGRG